MVRIILGSQSPRRKEILSYFSLPFEQVTPQFDEEAHPFTGNHVRPHMGADALQEGFAFVRLDMNRLRASVARLDKAFDRARPPIGHKRLG